MTFRLRALTLAVCSAALLAACAPDAAPGPVASPTSSADVDLVQLREGYGLPDCPATDPDAPALDGGLPRTALACLGGEGNVNLAGLPRVPTIINVWAQWCVPCREESPFLREALAALPDVSFLGINYNDPQLDWAIEFAALAGWRYPHVVDQDKTLQASLRVPGIPTTIFVDAEGRIAGTHAGQLTSTDQLLELADQYLGAT